jgi:hypothetical protein
MVRATVVAGIPSTGVMVEVGEDMKNQGRLMRDDTAAQGPRDSNWVASSRVVYESGLVIGCGVS